MLCVGVQLISLALNNSSFISLVMDLNLTYDDICYSLRTTSNVTLAVKRDELSYNNFELFSQNPVTICSMQVATSF